MFHLIGTPVMTLTATDGDDPSTPHGKLSYFVIDNRQENPERDGSQFFSIDGSTGVIKVKGALDRERQEEYDLVVAASDGDNEGETQRKGSKKNLLRNEVVQNRPYLTMLYMYLTTLLSKMTFSFFPS